MANFHSEYCCKLGLFFIQFAWLMQFQKAAINEDSYEIILENNELENELDNSREL